MSHLLVAVIGASTCTPDQAQAAEAVGRVLAQGGATVVCGGGGRGDGRADRRHFAR